MRFHVPTVNLYGYTEKGVTHYECIVDMKSIKVSKWLMSLV